MEELETITITFEDGEEEDFYVLEQTTLMGNHYFLVTPSEMEQDDACYVLKEYTDSADEEYGEYEFVEDEQELEALYPIFKELLEDSDLEVEF